MEKFMKKLLTLLIILPALSFGAANDIVLSQRNSADTGTVNRFVTPPASNANGLLAYNGATQLPLYWTLGSGLSLSSNSLIALPQDWSVITGKPTLFSGSYNDLTNKPTIPDTQVNSDWNSSSGVSQVLNKPFLFSGAYSDLTGKPVLFDGTWGSLSGKPTTLSGYGITDGVTASTYTTGLSTKFNNPTGSNLQYIRGDGSLATFPALSSGTVTSVVAGTGLSGGTIITSGTISMPNTGTAGTYVAVTTDAQGRVTAGRTRSFTYPTRTLNTAYQVSTTQDAFVNYSVDISVTSLLLGGSSGRVYLEYADNSGMTANLVVVNESGNSVAGVLNITNIGPGNVTGWIPANKYVRIRTASSAGSPNFTYVRGEEVLN